MNYNEYLRSDTWKEIRKRIWKRAGGTCERCRRWPGHSVHHLTYERVGHERDEDLQLLCDDCHKFVHGRLPVDPRNWEALLEYRLREWRP